MNPQTDWTIDPLLKTPVVDRRLAGRSRTVSRSQVGNDDSQSKPAERHDRRRPRFDDDAVPPDYRDHLRRFSGVSVIAILISAMLLVMVYRYFTLQSLLVETTAANVQVAEATETILANVMIARESDPNTPIPAVVHEMINEILKDTNIKRIRILDIGRHVLFAASDGDATSQDANSESDAGLARALSGKHDSRMAYRDIFNTMFGLLPAAPGDNLVLTAVPLQKDHQGPILGIVEIQTDITPMVKRNEKAQILIALTAALVMIVLFASLVAAIRRIQRVVEIQHHALQERSDLLAALSVEMLNVQEEEKQRIAHDLHERVAQTLATIKFGIESTSINVRHTDEHASKMLQALLDPVRDAIQEVRKTATELHPASLEDLGLIPTLNWLCRQLLEVRTDLSIDRRFPSSDETIPTELHPILFRIAEEACRVYKSDSNVTRVAITIRANDRHVILDLRDDGLPAYSDVGPTHPYHRIHDRALLSGGTFSGRSNSWGGLSATITWDLSLPTARPRW